MSTENSDIDPPVSDTEETAKPVAKKTTKRATKKTTKKVDKKSAKKTAKKDEEQLALFAEGAQEETEEPSKKKATRKKPVAKITEDTSETGEVSEEEKNKSTEKAAEKKESDADAQKDEKKPARKTTRKSSEKPTEKPAPSGEESGTEDLKEEAQPERQEIQGKKQRPPKKKFEKKKKEIVLTGDPVEVDGLIELAPKGYGFLRRPEKGYSQARDDVFVPPEQVKNHGIRHCQWVNGIARMGPKGLQLTEITKVNETPVGELAESPVFEDLKAVNPDKRISFESNTECFNTRILDLVSPVGRGQRGLIVAPPRSGKTTLLMDIAKSLMERHEDTIHPIFLLVDERPEEVTEFKRALPDIEMFSSSNDSGNRNHMRVSEMCIERAKRLVEEGKHVFILMDSITRLARAYNRGADTGGGGKGKHRGKNKNQGYQSGGLVTGALEVPRRLFAAARNTRDAGSLTILATALIQTNSKADEAIFQEFKGTGNMEVVLDRRLADHYIYPAVDIFKSGTRREELLLPEITLKKFHMIRRGLKGHRPDQAMERLLFFLKKFPSNAQMLMEIKG